MKIEIMVDRTCRKAMVHCVGKTRTIKYDSCGSVHYSDMDFLLALITGIDPNDGASELTPEHAMELEQ